MLTSDRADLKVIRDKEGGYIMIKGSILQEDITILNVYVPKKRAPKMWKLPNSPQIGVDYCEICNILTIF